MATILDHLGNPIDLSSIREPQTEQPENRARVGWIRNEWEGHPGRGLTPQLLNQVMLRAEHGDLTQQLDLADDMEERNAHLFSQLSVRKDAVINLDWSIEAPEDASAEEKKLAEEVEEWVRGIPNFEEDILRELLDGILKGFKAIEMWFELDQGLLMPHFDSLPQRMFTLSENRKHIHLRTGEAHGAPLKSWGWLVHQPRSRSGYPGRTGMVRILALPHLLWSYANRDLAEFLEIYGLPLRLGKYPIGASDAEKRTLLQAVVSIGHNAAGIIPAGMELDFMEAAKGTEGPFKTMSSSMEALISKAVLGQTLTSGEGEHGTQALGQVHDGVRMTICKSDAKRLSSTITAQLVAPMVLLNKPGVDRKRLPRFVIDVPEPEDLKLYADALPRLAAAGMEFPVEDTHKRLRIPRAKAGEPILKGPDRVAPAGDSGAPGQPPAGGPAPAPAPAPTPAPGPAPAPSPAGGPTPAPAPPVRKAGLRVTLPDGEHDALDDLVADAAADWRPVLEPMLQPLMGELDRAIEAGESIEAFRARLPELLDRMDSRPLAERQAKAAFLARLMGEADLDPSPEPTQD